MQDRTQKMRERLCHYYPSPEKPPFDESRLTVWVDPSAPGVSVRRQGDACEVTLRDSGLWGRAVTLLEEGCARDGDFSVTETPAYTLGAMVDCSRGAVPKPETLRRLMVLLSRMGYTVLQLYMEDTYELPGYPYFGYRRGGYTEADLRALDAFAGELGMELIPAVQTLAHLGQTLKWPAMEHLCDVGDILLADDEATAALIDRMFLTLSRTFTSRRINIGMDEAHLVGLGKYLDRHGYQDRMQLMLRHCRMVAGLAEKHGLKPMMWSDMFFRLASGGDYYAPNCSINPDAAAEIPPEMTLVYWDYYSEDRRQLDRMLEKHGEMTSKLIFAGGAWKWMGFGPNNRFSFHVGRLAHESCKAHGVKEVLVTCWGDNGAECPLFAVLPALQFWSEMCFAGSEEALASRFSLVCGGALEDFLLLDESAFTPDNPSPGRCSVNPPKYLLYQDPLCGLFDLHVHPDTYAAHFAACARKLDRALGACPEPWRYLFETQKALCDVLALKCRAGRDLRAAYEAGDRETLIRYRDEVLPRLLTLLETFIAAFHRQWLHENRAAGLDTFDLRLGGVCQRVKTAIERIGAFLSGDASALEELDVPLLSFDGKDVPPQGRDIAVSCWHRIVSPSNIGAV